MESIKKIVSKNIKLIRRSRGMTQEQLAEASGIDISTIQRYEAGDRWPRLNNIVELAKALKVNETSFFKKENAELIKTLSTQAKE